MSLKRNTPFIVLNILNDSEYKISKKETDVYTVQWYNSSLKLESALYHYAEIEHNIYIGIWKPVRRTYLKTRNLLLEKNEI